MESVDDCTETWKANILRQEIIAFVGVKSYEAMQRIGRKFIGTSEILYRLQKNRIVRQYLNIAHEKIDSDMVRMGLLLGGLACRGTPSSDGEEFYESVSVADFTEREKKLIEAVERIA